ncbi:hypothetical protein D6779_02665 [Candidatus Parcubacteria bacterium]|nr:MAG: hypothetical protein D6779_02665 [Candidatus Parcubacteria bacterium]
MMDAFGGSAGWLDKKTWLGWARFRRANGCIFNARGSLNFPPGGRVSHTRMGAFSIDKNNRKGKKN